MKSQMISRQITKIGNDYMHVKYVYSYVSDKQPRERKTGDFKGYKPIGKAIHCNIKTDGKYTHWTWELMYQKVKE